MIFLNSSSEKPLEIFESYKERNFYYKVFVGYLFNELLPDYEKKKFAFFDLLKDKIGSKQYFSKPGIDNDSLSNSLHELALTDIKVSFDYHLI